MSAETDPLLPQNQGQAAPKQPSEHQIFLRICHAPWSFVGTRTLLASRATIAMYMLAVWATSLKNDIDSDDTDARLFPFYAGNISYTFQTVYFTIASVWCMQHFVSPRNRPERQRNSSIVGQTLTLHERAMSMFSIPRTTEFTSSRRFAFSVFYSAAQTYPFVVTFLHYCVPEMSNGQFWTGDMKHDWIDFSKFGANSITAMAEIFVFSGIRKIKPFVEHCVAMSAITGLYFAWARLGHVATGQWTYPLVDPETQGTVGMFVNVVTLMGVSVAMYAAVTELHEIRDLIVKKSGLGKAH